MQLNDRACFHFRSLALHDHFSEISDWSVFWQPYTHWEKNPSYFLIKTCLQSIPSWKISLEPVDYISPYWEIPAMLPNFFHSHSLKIIKKYSNTRLTPLYFFPHNRKMKEGNTNTYSGEQVSVTLQKYQFMYPFSDWYHNSPLFCMRTEFNAIFTKVGKTTTL